jgi:hypothetical protein
VRFDQLHNELALQNHRISQVNEAKHMLASFTIPR